MDELEKALASLKLDCSESFEEKVEAGIKDFENGKYIEASLFLRKMKEKYVDVYDE